MTKKGNENLIRFSSLEKEENLKDDVKIGSNDCKYVSPYSSPEDYFGYKESLVKIHIDLDHSIYQTDWKKLRIIEMNMFANQKIKMNIITNAVGVFFDKINEILKMRWFENDRYNDWVNILKPYSEMCI